MILELLLPNPDFGPGLLRSLDEADCGLWAAISFEELDSKPFALSCVSGLGIDILTTGR